MTDWLSAAGIADHIGTTTRRVEAALRLVGLDSSKLNSRLEEGERVYSPGAVALVMRELRSRDTDIGVCDCGMALDLVEGSTGLVCGECIAGGDHIEPANEDAVERKRKTDQVIAARLRAKKDRDWVGGVMVTEPMAVLKIDPAIGAGLQTQGLEPMTVDDLRERVENAGSLRELTIEFERARRPAHGATVKLPLSVDGGRRWGPTSHGAAERVHPGVYEAQWLVRDLREWLETKGTT